LSGGQRQRVALARAIVREPRVFLMDEPLSNLDAKLRISTRAQIKNLQHELSTTTIYVTHDQIEAMTLADRVVVMNQGKIQQVGSPSEIYENPSNTFVAGFIGSPAMNLVKGSLNKGTFNTDGISIKGLSKDKNEDVILGFRAEDAKVVAKKAELSAKVYSFELLGDATMVTVKTNNQLISIKANKDYRVQIGDIVDVSIPLNKCHLFDINSGITFQKEVG
jgi:multiple sugar transport system ATP-binding protein